MSRNTDAIIDVLKSSIKAMQDPTQQDEATQQAIIDASLELGRELLNNIGRIADAIEELATKDKVT
jgi:hypothetical protein